MRRFWRLASLAISLLMWALPVWAQEVPAGAATQAHDATSSESWAWTIEGTSFFGYNYQRRKFRDFDAWESQNWLMASGTRALGTSRLRLVSMLSMEAFTLANLGSPQVFQTGETFEGAPLIDYQHPHDLVMQLGTGFSHQAGRTLLHGGAYLVGGAPIGPPPFMHRPSAAENPQAPLSHHYLDSTHITPGVVRAGVERSGWRLDAGWFRGQEPDENRMDFDLGALDSFAAQVSWARGPWSAEASNAWLTQPERVTPYDATQTTASLSYFSGDEDRSLAWMAAFGQKREFHGSFEAYLLEATLRRSPQRAFYARAEWVVKDILDAGFHPVGIKHTHRPSPVGALTLGYVHDLVRQRNGAKPSGGGNPLGLPWGSIAIGADVTGYVVPANLQDPYGSPVSFHVFVRYRGRAGAAAHVH